MSETGLTLIKFGAIILAIQNLLFIFTLSSGLNEAIFYLDILGFVLLGAGLILESQEDELQKTNLLIAGLGVIGWVVSRIYWQFILADSIFDSTGDDQDAVIEDGINTLIDMVSALLLSSVLLVVASFFYFRTKRGGSTIFLTYGIFNFIGTYLFASPFLTLEANPTDAEIDSAITSVVLGVFMKLLIIPILGIVTFFILFSRNNDHLEMQ